MISMRTDGMWRGLPLPMLWPTSAGGKASARIVPEALDRAFDCDARAGAVSAQIATATVRWRRERCATWASGRVCAAEALDEHDGRASFACANVVSERHIQFMLLVARHMHR
jgi:hypothetical protein